MWKRSWVTAKVGSDVKWDTTCAHPYLPGTKGCLLSPVLSLPRHHLSPAGPPRVCVLPRHLGPSPPPGGPLLGQTLPAAPRGPGADCQESGHLERWGGQTRSHTHTAPTQRKADVLFVHSSVMKASRSGNLRLRMNAEGELSGSFIASCVEMPVCGFLLQGVHLSLLGGQFCQRTPRV